MKTYITPKWDEQAPPKHDVHLEEACLLSYRGHSTVFFGGAIATHDDALAIGDALDTPDDGVATVDALLYG